MKKHSRINRILSGILAFVTLLPLMPLQAWGTESVTKEPVSVSESVSPRITRAGVKTQAIRLAAHERIEINAEGSADNAVFQWQIAHPEKEAVWINIYDATHGYLFVTLALVRNMMTDDNIARLRCRVTEGEQVRYTDPVTVQFCPEIPYIPETTPETEPIVETLPPVEILSPTEPETTAPAETAAPTEPETTAPAETAAPTVPETTAPAETVAPTVPETTAPIETAAPTVPETTAPAETVAPTMPETTAPAETAAPTVPETTAPAETLAPFVPETQPLTAEKTDAARLAKQLEAAASAETAPAETTAPAVPETTAPAQTVPTVVTQDTAAAEAAAADPVDPENSEFVTVRIDYVRYDFYRDAAFKLVPEPQNPEDWEKPVYHGGYLLDNDGHVAFTSYVATLQSGTDLNATVPIPTIVGYDTYLNGVKVTAVQINQTNITENIEYTVEYRPAQVSYTIRYYFQNIYDDLYVEDTSQKQTAQGYTGSVPPDDELRKEFPGFLSLYYQPDSIAADGSTVFEVYYERNYYLMEFDCDGGYGTETLYNRYGSYISVPNPVKSGYIFAGWDLVTGTDAEGRPIGDGTADTLPETMPMENTAYIALWTTDATSYTVVYWRENANDTGYSYWDSKIIGLGNNGQPNGTVRSNDLVSGTDHQTVTGLPNSEHFTYNAVKTQLEEAKRTDLREGKVIVQGDGSTVVNVYYSRNYYTIYFKGYGTCAITPHTHGTDCQYRYYCGQGTHVHDATCNATLICTIPEHTAHTAECWICGKEEHTHSDDCCSTAEHVHSTACCSKTEHTHSTSCYTLSKGSWGNAVTDNNWLNAINGSNDKSDAGIVLATRRGTTGYFYQIDDTWYQITGLSNNWWNEAYWQNVTITQNQACQNAHTHGDGNCDTAKCGLTAHTHGDGNCTCTDQAHVHSESCYKDVIHTHTESCYSYTCNEESHTHTTECYDCILPTHTHTNNCTSNSTSNTIYVITAKFEQDIGDIWPTYDVLKAGTHAYEDSNGNVENANGNRFRGWTIDGVSSEAVSKRVTMTDDLCDTSDGVKNATANYDYDYYVHLYYMFESFDQTSPENGNERKLYNGVYYDKSSVYYQDVYANSATFGQKDITGMIEQGVQSSLVSSNEYNNFLYYTRSRVTFKFHNVNTTVATIENIMFGQPLKDLTVDGNPASSYVPPYPTTYEPEAYEFGGWYTTPECFDGTEVDWANASMPNTEMEIYSKWTPIKRNVTFYTFYDDIAAGVEPFLTADDVPHGEILGSTYNKIPTGADDLRVKDYRFIGWFYMDEDNKKKFAPDSMEVTRDLVLFAEWSTELDTTYEVRYVLKDAVSKANTPSQTAYDAGAAVADVTFGHSSVGKTKTFNAKALGELYSDFQKKFFPTSNSHSILMKEDGAQNTYTFEYIYDAKVFYKIRYLEAGTNKVLEETVVKGTDAAVVTEKFLPIAGYIPQSYYIRKTLSSDGEGNDNLGDDNLPPESEIHLDNVITFYYVKDTEHGLYSIEYYLENADSANSNDRNNYTQYESIVGAADLGHKITADVRPYEGYTHVPELNTVITYQGDGKPNAPITDLTGTVTVNGLTIQLYYERNQYPYIVEYREYGAAEDAEPLKTLSDADSKADFGSQISWFLPEKDGDYKPESDTITINDQIYEYYIEDPTDADLTKSVTIRAFNPGEDNPNKLIFYFVPKKVEVHYDVAYRNAHEGMPELCRVSMASESAATAANLSGSSAMTAAGFTFVGWYLDAAGNNPVKSNWVSDEGKKLIPQTLDTTQDEVHYYALFEPVDLNVIYEENGGVEISDRTARIGETFTLPSTTRTGYTLTGWWYDADEDGNVDEGEEYAPGADFTMPGKDVTLTAQWIDERFDNKHKVFVGLNMSFYNSSHDLYYKFPEGEPRIVSLEAARAYIASIGADGKNTWAVQEGYWDNALCKPGVLGVPAEPKDYIDPAILNQVTTNGDVIGVFDETGKATRALLYFTENDYNAIIEAWLGARDYFEDHFSHYNINWEKLPKPDPAKGEKASDLYEAVPYVIKRHYHGLTDNNDWFIDFVILPKNRFKVEYRLNLPDNFTDEEPPEDKNLYGQGMYVDVENFHDVPCKADDRYVAKFVGWTAVDANDKPVAIDSKTNKFTMPGSNVILEAQWEFCAPLTIAQTGMKDNESAIYRVTGNGVDLTVSITGNDQVTILELPLGAYTVTELTNWSWAYDNQSPVSQKVTLTNQPGQPHPALVTFTNRPMTESEYKWLHGETHEDNIFAAVTADP